MKHFFRCFDRLGGLSLSFLLIASCAWADDADAPNEASAEDKSVEADAPAMDVPLDALVIVTGDNGVGSGFLAEMKGRYFIVTNIHVLAGNEQVVFATATGQALPANPHIFVASEEDVAIIPIAKPDSFLPVSGDGSQPANIGDDIVVMGNAQGASVVTRLEGKVDGVGPDRYEVSATFVPGNSGSPVLHEASGEVIGVAAYLVDNSDSEDKWLEESEFKKIRRFAFRIDSVKEWQRASLAELKRDHDAVEEYESLLDGVLEFSLTLSKQKRFLMPERAHPELKSALRTFFKVYDGRHRFGSTGNRRAVDDLQKDIDALMFAGYNRANDRLKYGYFQSRLESLGGMGEALNAHVQNQLR